jgi:hypothetical protein
MIEELNAGHQQVFGVQNNFASRLLDSDRNGHGAAEFLFGQIWVE